MWFYDHGEVMASPRLLYVDNLAAMFESHRSHLALAASKAGFEVHVAAPPSPALDRLGRRGLTTHPIDLDRRSRAPGREIATISSICRVIRRVQPSIVHLRTIKPVIYGGMASRLMAVPAVVTHITGLGTAFTGTGARYALLRSILRPIYRHIHVPRNRIAIFQNPDDRRALCAAGMVSPRRTRLIRGSGVDLRVFTAQPIPEGTPIIVLASRMLEEKGIRDFVAAAKLLRLRAINVRMVLVGDVDEGNPKSIPRQDIEAWNARADIEWWGRVDDMPSIYAQSTVVCLPSFYGEGLPKCLLEAMAVGRPIITTDSPGCREACIDGVNGLLVPPRKASSLADAIARLVADRALCARMGQEGRRIAEREFSIERIIRETLSVYWDLLGMGGSNQCVSLLG